MQKALKVFASALMVVVVLLVPTIVEAQQSSKFSLPLDQGFGFNTDFFDMQPGELKMLAGSGVRWIRMDFKWEFTELEKGRYDFSKYDRFVAAFEQEKIRPLFILDYGNFIYGEPETPRSAATKKAFARWAVAAAKHFAGRGVWWEVYNEPNHDAFWKPRPNVAEYVELALGVGKAFKEEVPNETLIGPATSGIDLKFLEGCFKAGLLNYWSAVSVHPYLRGNPEPVANEYTKLRQLIDKYSPGDRKGTIPIISSEWGYSAAWDNIDAAKQAELLARSWLTNLANGIPLSIWYDWKNDGLVPSNAEFNFGTVEFTYGTVEQPFQPKPAYFAAKALTSFLAGSNFVSRLRMAGDEDDYVLSFRNADEVRLAAWTSSSDSHEIKTALPSGLYQGVDYLGKEVRTFKSVKGVLSITLSSTPIYIKKIHKEM